MHDRLQRRSVRWLAAACLAVLSTGCGERPLETVGERSNEWIGPIADGISLFSNDSSPPGPTVLEPEDDSVRVSEGDG